MRNKTQSITLLLAMMLGTTQIMASDLYVYPAKGQSKDQQNKDEYECYQWAKGDTGFDPMATPTTSTSAPSTQQRQGGVVRGGLLGAAVGGIAGGSSSDAGKGAVIGGLLGGVRQRSQNVSAQQERQQWEQQEASRYANNRNNYNRAYAACLEGRGYTVK